MPKRKAAEAEEPAAPSRALKKLALARKAAEGAAAPRAVTAKAPPAAAAARGPRPWRLPPIKLLLRTLRVIIIIIDM